MRRRARFFITDGDFQTHSMGELCYVDGKIVISDQSWMIEDLRKGIVGEDGRTLTFDDGIEFIESLPFALRDKRTWAVEVDDLVDLDAAKLAWSAG